MTDDADPILAAVEQALREQTTAWWQTPPRLDLAADIAAQGPPPGGTQIGVGDVHVDSTEAHSHIAGTKSVPCRQRRSDKPRLPVVPPVQDRLLAALADAEIARRQAEADVQRLREQNKAVRTKAAALLDGELAHRSRDYGRGVAQATRDILAALDGEESH